MRNLNTQITYLKPPEKIFFDSLEFIINNLTQSKDTPKYVLNALHAAKNKAAEICKENSTASSIDAYNKTLINFDGLLSELTANIDNLFKKHAELSQQNASPHAPNSDTSESEENQTTDVGILQAQLNHCLSQLSALEQYQNNAEERLTKLFNHGPATKNTDAIEAIVKATTDEISKAQKENGHITRSYGLEKIDDSISNNIHATIDSRAILIRRGNDLLTRINTLCGQEPPNELSTSSASDSSDTVKSSDSLSETELVILSDSSATQESEQENPNVLRRHNACFFGHSKRERPESVEKSTRKHRTENAEERSQSPAP